MNCPRCGSVLLQEELFCGQCGFDLKNAPTLLSQKQAPWFHSGTTVVDLDVASAMLATANPYSSYIGRLPMPNLILNDDVKKVWREVHQQGNTKVPHWAQYTKEGLRIQSDCDDEKGFQNLDIGQRSPVMIGESFTLQVLMHFYPIKARNDVHIQFDASPDESIIWQLTAFSGEIWGRGYPFPGGDPMPSWKLSSPRSLAYNPFLFGIVRQGNEWAVFLNLEHVALQRFKNSQATQTMWLSNGWATDLSISHTRVWIP